MEDNPALDDMAELDCLHRMAVLVKVILLLGIACWRPDVVGSSLGLA